MFNVGDQVRLIGNPARTGVVLCVQRLGDETYVNINFPDRRTQIPEDQLELVPSDPETGFDFLRRGLLGSPTSLRKLISHIRISGRLVDMIYSMEATDTDFYAHQFKPVLKLLNSPTGNLLIADEVGLGKTIEAGLIWTELAARFQFNRLLVICPKVLCTKWKEELETKFGLSAQIMKAEELRYSLENQTAQKKGFVAICGMQGIRPKPKRKRENSQSDQLANLIDEIDEFDQRIDLLIIDEAHHLRNPGTQTNALGPMFTKLAFNSVMLSATPINLRSRDLHSLLNLLDKDTFSDEESLDRIITANAPLIEAKEAIELNSDVETISECIERAKSSPLLAKTAQLRRISEEISQFKGKLGPKVRATLITRLEKVNLLANVINRTRRRDVDEFRVIRHVTPIKMEMNSLERDVYDSSTRVILNYANDRDLPTGFVTMTPQRMLASCLPATIRHWKSRNNDFGVEDAENFDEDKPGPIIQTLSSHASLMPSFDELAAVDTKFLALLEALKNHFSENSKDKLIIFSTFRSTLEYLSQRLLNHGFPNIIMHGLSRDRTDLVTKFANSKIEQIFLSSEVGSEGIDLQFARCVVNYDLPWNPMRVEQRIGRVDRLGQTADTIAVINLFHQDTVDDRIYSKLYERLKLCETALGGFEEILGKEIEQLTSSLFSDQLSEQDKDFKIQQAAQAIENRKQIEDDLESEASALIAHGDYVLQSIMEARDNHRWISEEDIVDYLQAMIGELYTGCDLRWDKEHSSLKLDLTAEVKVKYGDWAQANNLDPGPLAHSAGSFDFQLGKSKIKSRKPKLSQSHPFVRFLAYEAGISQIMKEEAIGAQLNVQKTTISEGFYAGAVQSWKFGQGAETEKLGISFFKFPSGQFLNDDQSEQLINDVILEGRQWANAADEIDFETIAEQSEYNLSSRLLSHFAYERSIRKEEIEDRVSIQLATLDAKAENDIRSLEDRVANSSERMRAANQGRLTKLHQRIELRRATIKKQLDETSESQDVCTVIVKVGQYV